MRIKNISNYIEFIARLIFLIIPTSIFSYWGLYHLNVYFSILENNALNQAIHLFIAMSSALLIYSFRLRFISSFILLILILSSIYKGIDISSIGEFDSFFLSIKFLILSTLWVVGWLIGASFARYRYAHFVWSGIALTIAITFIAKQNFESFALLMQVFYPILLYSFYIVFANEQVHNFTERNVRFWWFMIRRILLFISLSLFILYFLNRQMKPEFEKVIKQNAGRNENGMLKKNKDGTFDLKDYSQLKSQQGRNNELIFAAYIDNFLQGTDIPNPLYLTAFYYSKFDTSTETFERDVTIPKNDLFEPDISNMPLYSSITDSNVINTGMEGKGRKSVDIIVYNVKLSNKNFLAPHIGYFVQPIAVDKDYKSQFTSAYKAKGYVSDLNSAYFVYNSKDPVLAIFQEQRFRALRKAGTYSSVDKDFYDYYTQMPQDDKFNKIAKLAHQIMDSGATTVDNVLAVRDYFLSKDKNGKALFSYTDNPGIPDIPSASKLMYFLFENHKGYCAYYAGATLFLLRAMGIPSRIVVGFMTIDRSDKNKGWYWYYTNQAHAWIQVYFPGFGWLDFDTTVGNDDAQESPSPDGTPPLQPPYAYLASLGQITAIDTINKTLKLKTNKIIYHDNEIKSKDSVILLQLDVSLASIQKDSLNISINNIKIGDSATVVSYTESLKNIKPNNVYENIESLVQRLPKPIPIDEVYLTNLESKKLINKPQTDNLKAVNKHTLILKITLWIMFICMLYLLIPILIFRYYIIRSKLVSNYEQKAYWQYTAWGFYLHQLGFKRGDLTSLEYSINIIDKYFDTSYSSFIHCYLKLKYAKQEVSELDIKTLSQFWQNNLPKIKNKISVIQRFKAFLRPLRSLSYYNRF